eukprot:2595924-Pyramimonas_sp.AAC.1
MVSDNRGMLLLVAYYKTLVVNGIECTSTIESQSSAHNLQKIPPPDLHMSAPAARCFSSLLASTTHEDPILPVATPAALVAAPAPTLQTAACDHNQIPTTEPVVTPALPGRPRPPIDPALRITHAPKHPD